MTLGSPASTRSAVTTIAGRTSPASDPDGVPRSSSTTSPEVSIEPIGLLAPERRGELSADLLLPEEAHSTSDGARHRGLPLASESLQLLVRRTVDADGGCLGHTRSIQRGRQEYLH